MSAPSIGIFMQQSNKLTNELEDGPSIAYNAYEQGNSQYGSLFDTQTPKHGQMQRFLKNNNSSSKYPRFVNLVGKVEIDRSFH